MSLVLQLYRYSLKVVRPVFAITFVLSAALPNLHSQNRRPDTSATTALSELAADFEKKTNTLASEMRLSFRLQAAQALLTSSPELSQRFVNLSVDEIKQTDNMALESGAILALAATAPAQASTLITHLQPGADERLISALAYTHHDDVALSLYREMLARDKLSLWIAEQLVQQLYTHDPAEATKLVQEIASRFSFDDPEPGDLWSLVKIASAIRKSAAETAADLYERVATAAAAENFGKRAHEALTAKVTIGSQPLTTADSRETLLLAAGTSLYLAAPNRFEKLAHLFAQWDLTKPVEILSVTHRLTRPSTPDPVGDAIAQKIGKLRQMREPDRSLQLTEIAGSIRALQSGGSKLFLAQQLAGMTVGADADKSAAAAVALALADALREKGGETDAYVQLARLIPDHADIFRERNPAFEAAKSLVKLRNSGLERSAFVLTGLDGKEYSLVALRGKVILLNFWATWCGPCRGEMPDLERLYQQLQKKGLVILAVSDEQRETVAKLIQEQKYSFPVLSDPTRKMHSAFDIVGIPQTFIFDRNGQLIAHVAKEMSQQEFRKLLVKAGL